MCRYLTTNELIQDQMKSLYNIVCEFFIFWRSELLTIFTPFFVCGFVPYFFLLPLSSRLPVFWFCLSVCHFYLCITFFVFIYFYLHVHLDYALFKGNGRMHSKNTSLYKVKEFLCDKTHCHYPLKGSRGFRG